jgi:membrane-associated phospholipid phosphatase
MHSRGSTVIVVSGLALCGLAGPAKAGQLGPGITLVRSIVFADAVPPRVVSETDSQAATVEHTNFSGRSSDSMTNPADAPQQTPTPPQPEHTGFAAIVYKTAADFKAFPRRKSTWVILGIGGAAAGLAHPVDDSVNARLVGSKGAERFWVPGHILGSDYVQAGTAVGLYVVGRYIVPPAPDGSRTNKLSHLGFDLVRAQLVSQGFVQGIKFAVRRDRPTGNCCGFPSGHATATFATAAVLERHLGYRAAWPTLALATYVATSRLHDNVHFLSDVLFGAALGEATGWTIVCTHGRTDFTLAPVAVPGGVMTVSYTI